MRQLRQLGTVTLGKMLASEPRAESDQETAYLRAANIQPDGVLDLSDLKAMWFSVNELKSLELRAGDVIVVEGGQGGFGRAAFLSSDLPGIAFQNSINRVRPGPASDGRFITYALLSARSTGYLHAYSDVVSMPHLTAEKLGRLRVPAPSLSEQHSIADFLDRETARIDDLIGKQRLLASALRERRQAVIDSAIPWGGDRAQLRRDLEFLTSGSRGWGDFYADEGEPFLRIGDLSRGSYRLETDDLHHVRIPKGTEGSRSRTKVGDLLFSITAYLGSIGVVPPELADSYVSQHVALARIGQRVWLPEFVAWCVLSGFGQDQLNQQSYGGTKMQLSLGDVRAIELPVIPMNEQQGVIRHLGHITAEIDRVLRQTAHLVELAHERRSALITAAVTGQLNLAMGKAA